MKVKKERRSIAYYMNIAILMILSVSMLYPFLNAIAISFSDSVESASKIITIFPVGFTLKNYQTVFARDDVIRALVISIIRTIIGSGVHLFVTGLAAYALSIKTLPFRKSLITLSIIPMFLTAGMIPGFINIYELGLINSFWVYVFPLAYAAYHMLIMKTFFEGIPESLKDAAKVDGAAHITVFIKIILPLSKPIIATIGLFIGVQHWNSWFDANIYVTSVSLHPLSMLLRRILFEAELMDPSAIMASTQQNTTISPQGIKMATLIISTLPIMTIYPFCQKYFVEGVMIGAVKG